MASLISTLCLCTRHITANIMLVGWLTGMPAGCRLSWAGAHKGWPALVLQSYAAYESPSRQPYIDIQGVKLMFGVELAQLPTFLVTLQLLVRCR